MPTISEDRICIPIMQKAGLVSMIMIQAGLPLALYRLWEYSKEGTLNKLKAMEFLYSIAFFSKQKLQKSVSPLTEGKLF